LSDTEQPALRQEPGPRFVSVAIATAQDDDGWLVFLAGQLVAVLTRLDLKHGENAGACSINVAFGALNDATDQVFPSLDAAADWIRRAISSAKARHRIARLEFLLRMTTDDRSRETIKDLIAEIEADAPSVQAGPSLKGREPPT